VRGRQGREIRLTQRFVNDAAPGPAKVRIADLEVRGLYLRIMPSGAKSYVVRLSKNGRRGEAAIGDARSITLAAARARAVDAMSDLAVRDIHPADAKRKAVAAEKSRKNDVFSAVAARYFEDAQRRKRQSSIAYETWLFNKFVGPQFNNRHITEIRRAEIIAFIENTGDKSGAATANGSHALVRQILNYALKRDLIEANPALAIERLFPAPTRDRVLNDSEMRRLWRFWEAARLGEGKGLLRNETPRQRPVNGLSPSLALALQLCLLTLQRANEVAGAREEEFIWRDKVWVIPASRMKGKRAHAVPLSDMALTRFKAAFDISEGVIAFPDRTGLAAIEAHRLTRAMGRSCKILGVTPNAGPHDLRRTGRTALTSERLGVSYEAAERVLAHLVGSAVSRVYDRNEYLKEKRAALDAWAAEVEAIVND